MADIGMRKAYPFGTLESNFIDEERIKRLNNAFQKASWETKVINVPVGNGQVREASEEDVIDYVVDRVQYAYEIPENNIELPGMQLNMDLLKGFASLYKKDSDTPSGTIKPPELATVDDIVFGFCTPQVWYEIANSAGNQYDYTISGLTQGDNIGIVDDNGIGNAGSADSSLDLDAASGWNPWLFFTGDFIELHSDRIVTEIEFQDVDDEDYGPQQVLAQSRTNNLGVLTTNGHIAKATVDIDSYAYQGGTTELVPICFYMNTGPAPTSHI